MQSGIILFILIFISVSAGATAVEQPCSRNFDVGVADYPPVFMREKGRRVGIGVDIGKELFRRTGCNFAVVEFTRPVAITRMRQGRMDLFLLVGSEYEFNEMATFVKITEAERSLTYLTSLKKSFPSVESLLADKKMRVGVMIGSHSTWTPEELATLNAEGRAVGAPNPEGLFKMLKAGRVQAVLFPTATTLYYLNKLKMTSIVTRLPDPVHSSSVGYVYSNRRLAPKEIEMITKHMEAMRADGTLKKIFDKYFESNSPVFRTQ
ncbi:substrate-binding periplasmic protein [Bdellovibrio sp. HCB288]|uniref:substrate-binding periplasmic protein n=1 Tax=Bdellovibrio sp. HCB288 TaxID=3394355 RepID=UPI0039B6C02B